MNSLEKESYRPVGIALILILIFNCQNIAAIAQGKWKPDFLEFVLDFKTVSAPFAVKEISWTRGDRIPCGHGEKVRWPKEKRLP